MSQTPHSRPTGLALLHDPRLNKGTAFSPQERSALGLRGLLPAAIGTMEKQELRALENLRRKPNNLEKYVYLAALQERNETLFFHLAINHLEELMPLIYTPTVGQACQEYGHIFRRPSGMFISRHDRGHIRSLLNNWPSDDVRVIVVTDGERILGLGDLGADGMGIPVGKLALYVACAGIHPDQCLPVMLDVGTNDVKRRHDPLYIGLAEERLRGPEYDALVEEFMAAVVDRWPRVLVQLEDFGNANAFRLLHEYRHRACVFDDDIQGTASVVLAGLISAMRMTGGRLQDQRLLFLGAGEAGIGIGDLYCAALQEDGVAPDAAHSKCWFIDSKGLVVQSRTDLSAHKRPYAHAAPPMNDLEQIIRQIRPTALIGVAGIGRAFTEPVVKAMAEINERPIIMALSNPTSKAECTAGEAYGWTDGRCVFASGSPFDPVTLNGKVFVPGQGNNAYVFPGIGLGVLCSAARHVTDELFLVAARALASMTTDADLAQGRIYPALRDIRRVSAEIATRVATCAHDRGLAAEPRPADIAAEVNRRMYWPAY